MVEQLSPAFHAEIILELFNEFGCVRKVSQRAGVLLSSYSPEHLEAISRHLPKELVQVLPRRHLRAAWEPTRAFGRGSFDRADRDAATGDCAAEALVRILLEKVRWPALSQPAKAVQPRHRRI
jgi:hypothetical protein